MIYEIVSTLYKVINIHSIDHLMTNALVIRCLIYNICYNQIYLWLEAFFKDFNSKDITSKINILFSLYLVICIIVHEKLSNKIHLYKLYK